MPSPPSVILTALSGGLQGNGDYPSQNGSRFCQILGGYKRQVQLNGPSTVFLWPTEEVGTPEPICLDVFRHPELGLFPIRYMRARSQAPCQRGRILARDISGCVSTRSAVQLLPGNGRRARSSTGRPPRCCVLPPEVVLAPFLDKEGCHEKEPPHTPLPPPKEPRQSSNLAFPPG